MYIFCNQNIIVHVVGATLCYRLELVQNVRTITGLYLEHIAV